MKISIVQYNIAWEDKKANYRKLNDLIAALYGKTDIVILPEMFNTGFSMNPDSLREAFEGETFHWLADAAVKGNFGICGSYIVSEKEHNFNRWVFVTPEKGCWHYDKRHLFSLSGEDKLFTQGRQRLIFSFRGFRISPNICYDLRFPVWSRNSNEYDLMINSANWPESRREVWNILLKARAIENQCFVAGSNRIGTDGAGIKYMGESMILNPRGNVIASDNKDMECIIASDISMTELSEFRKKFPVMNDVDKFTLDI